MLAPYRAVVVQALLRGLVREAEGVEDLAGLHVDTDHVVRGHAHHGVGRAAAGGHLHRGQEGRGAAEGGEEGEHAHICGRWLVVGWGSMLGVVWWSVGAGRLG